MHVVTSKATSMDKSATERVVEDLGYLGHTRVIIRSDNEPELLQQFDSAAAEGSVPHDPQTAGAAEVSVREGYAPKPRPASWQACASYPSTDCLAC